MTATIYGIRNCDTVRKARRWLDDNGIEYRFHDLRADGLETGTLQAWERKLGWEQLLNRRGTSWRKLPAETRDGIDRERALQIMQDNPAIIKRPLLAADKQLLLGFSPDSYSDLFD